MIHQKQQLVDALILKLPHMTIKQNSKRKTFIIPSTNCISSQSDTEILNIVSIHNSQNFVKCQKQYFLIAFFLDNLHEIDTSFIPYDTINCMNISLVEHIRRLLSKLFGNRRILLVVGCYFMYFVMNLFTVLHSQNHGKVHEVKSYNPKYPSITE